MSIDRAAPARAAVAALRAALFMVGFTALAVQTLLLRELMVAWRGNEMSFALTLSAWLALTGVGGLAYGSPARRRRFSSASFAGALVVLGGLAPTTLLLARAARVASGLPAGELAGLPPLILSAVASLAPFTVLAGFIFANGVSLLAEHKTDRGAAVGEVYVLEAAGAVAAGILLSFVLLGRWAPARIAFLAMSLNCALAFAVHRASRRAAARGRTVPAVALLLSVGAAICSGPPGAALEDVSVAAQWRDLGFRSQANSLYGLIVTTQYGSQRAVYQSGVLVASAPDRLVAEETVHLTMLQHAEPKRVLLLGGGLGGSVAEILKHPSVESLDYVELDPYLVREARRRYGDEMVAGLSDERVETHFADARFFVKRADPGYDVVIVSVPDPTTAQLNRFYTLEFFRELRAILAPGGLVGASVSSAENYISDELAAVLECVRTTMLGAFETVLLIPGDPCHFVASSAGVALTRDAETLSARIEARSLDVLYVRDYYLFDRLSDERAGALDSAVARVDSPPNTDLSPSCYYMGLILWSRQLEGVSSALDSAPRFVTLSNAAVLALAVVALVAVARARRRGRSAALRAAVITAVFVVGGTEISLEVASIMAFQSFYGYVYGRIALIVAAFMAGLAIGGLAGARAAARGAGLGALALLQLGMALVPVAFAWAIARIGGLPPDALAAWSLFFPVLVVGSAILAGAQFPLAARLYGGRSDEPGMTAGRLYGADLAGAALGATLAAVFLLPILGLVDAMIALSILNLGVLAAFAVPALSAGGAR